MDDLPARLRQGVVRHDAIYLDDGLGLIDVPATQDVMAASADELNRLRKIEEAARLMSDWLHDNPATESRISMVGRILLTDLRTSLETETDD